MTDDGLLALDEQTLEDKWKSEWLDDLQELVDFLDEHRDLIPGGGVDIYRFAHSGDEFTRLLIEAGHGEKDENSYSIGLIRTFGTHKLAIRIPRTVTCERVDTGKREEITVGEGEEPPSDAIPTGKKLVRTFSVPVTEWSCPPALLGIGRPDVLSEGESS